MSFGSCITYLCVVLLAVDGVLGALAALLAPVRVELPQLVLALERPSAQACAQLEVTLAQLLVRQGQGHSQEPAPSTLTLKLAPVFSMSTLLPGT